MLLLNATRWSGRTYAEGRALGNGVLYAMNATFCTTLRTHFVLDS